MQQTQDNTKMCYWRGNWRTRWKTSWTLQVEINPLENKIGVHKW